MLGACRETMHCSPVITELREAPLSSLPPSHSDIGAAPPPSRDRHKKMQKNFAEERALDNLLESASGAHAAAEPVRLFVGIAPDGATQRFLDATRLHLQGLRLPRDCRWIGSDNRHLTLAFLGDTEVRHLPVIVDTLRAIAAHTPPCSGQIVSTHPFPRDRAKMLAAELLPSPPLATLHGKCRDMMMTIGKQPERKSFRPHFTLARSRSGFSRLPAVPADFHCALDNITLYHSLLAPGGSQYQPLLSLPLEGESH